ncbi:MAG: peptidoglycan DD-metalloendopeptidase family protein [Ruminococcus sp.]|nr:peptidoglycan DD-metalloendopeptidase family protein [Ruminococcus sp.]
MKRILSCIICLCIMLGCVLTVTATSIEEIKQQQQQLEQQSAEYEAVLNQKNAEVAEQQEYVDAIVGKVETVTKEIQVSHQKIDALDKEIDDKTAQIKQKNDEIEENMDILRQRIKTIYLAGEVSSLEIILGAKDFSDFLDKVQLVKSVSAHDEQLINDIQAQLEVISKEKEALESDKKELQEEEKNLKEKQDELNVLLEENKETLATLQEESNEALAQLSLTEAQISELDEELQEYYRKQQEALKQQQQQQQQSSSNSSSSSSSGSAPAPVRPNVDPPSGGGYVWPCPGHYNLTSSFDEWRGYVHGALDIADGGIMGATVVAASGGQVVATNTSCPHNWGKSYSCGCGGGYGNYVWINHGNGKETVYAHLTSVAVSTGQSVSAGQYIGTVGSTGHSTGAHLHYETRYNGVKYNPMTEY